MKSELCIFVGVFLVLKLWVMACRTSDSLSCFIPNFAFTRHVLKFTDKALEIEPAGIRINSVVEEMTFPNSERPNQVIISGEEKMETVTPRLCLSLVLYVSNFDWFAS